MHTLTIIHAPPTGTQCDRVGTQEVPPSVSVSFQKPEATPPGGWTSCMGWAGGGA